MEGPATTTTLERPPPGPARGRFPAPLWLVVLLSVALLGLAAYSLARAWRRRQR